MMHRLTRELPDKTFIAGRTGNYRCNDCRFMKMNRVKICSSAYDLRVQKLLWMLKLSNNQNSLLKKCSSGATESFESTIFITKIFISGRGKS